MQKCLQLVTKNIIKVMMTFLWAGVLRTSVDTNNYRTSRGFGLVCSEVLTNNTIAAPMASTLSDELDTFFQCVKCAYVGDAANKSLERF